MIAFTLINRDLRHQRCTGDSIIFDPHVAGCRVISLDETEATALRDTMREWLG